MVIAVVIMVVVVLSDGGGDVGDGSCARGDRMELA